MLDVDGDMLECFEIVGPWERQGALGWYVFFYSPLHGPAIRGRPARAGCTGRYVFHLLAAWKH